MEVSRENVITLQQIRNGQESFSKANTHIHSNLDLVGKIIPKTSNQFYSEHHHIIDAVERVTPYQATREKVILDFPKKEYKFTNITIFKS